MEQTRLKLQNTFLTLMNGKQEQNVEWLKSAMRFVSNDVLDNAHWWKHTMRYEVIRVLIGESEWVSARDLLRDHIKANAAVLPPLDNYKLAAFNTFIYVNQQWHMEQKQQRGHAGRGSKRGGTTGSVSSGPRAPSIEQAKRELETLDPNYAQIINIYPD